MTSILIFDRNGKTLELTGKWEDGEWVIDEGDFSEISHIDEYTEEMILDRFSGPHRISVFERNAPDLEGKIEIDFTRSAVAKGVELGDFMETKLEMVHEYERGELDEEDYTDEEWVEIEQWVEDLG